MQKGVCPSAPSCMACPRQGFAMRQRSFSLRSMLAQKLDDLLIALFLRVIQRLFPVRVLLVHVRFLIQQQCHHLLLAANDSLVQKGNVLVILYVRVRAAIQQSFGGSQVAMDHRQAQRRPTILLDFDVHVCLVGQQQFYRVSLVKCCRPVQGRESVPVQQIHIRFLSQKQFHHLCLTVQRRPVQRFLAASVPGAEQLLVLFQKSGNLVHVADSRRGKNVFLCPPCQQ